VRGLELPRALIQLRHLPRDGKLRKAPIAHGDRRGARFHASTHALQAHDVKLPDELFSITDTLMIGDPAVPAFGRNQVDCA